MSRAERLAYVAAELRNVRANLIALTGSPRCSEVKMVLDLECAVMELGRLADRPRSSASTIRRWSQQGIANGSPR